MHLHNIFLAVFAFALSVQAASQALPPPPPRVTDLKFSELLETPVRDRGLGLSDKAKGLNGKRVRLLGHMVRQDSGIPGVLLLTPMPLQLHDEHYGLADDLPPATVFVSAPFQREGTIQYKPGLLLVTGILSVGNREEPDGRISVFRIELDPPRKAHPSSLLQATKTGQTRLQQRTQPDLKRHNASHQKQRTNEQ
jgi:hypothetical protein